MLVVALVSKGFPEEWWTGAHLRHFDSQYRSFAPDVVTTLDVPIAQLLGGVVDWESLESSVRKVVLVGLVVELVVDLMEPPR